MTNKLASAAYLRSGGSYKKAGIKFDEGNEIIIYKDLGYNGASDPFSRPAMSILLEDVKKGKVSKIKIDGLSRISRNKNTVIQIVELMKENNVELEGI